MNEKVSRFSSHSFGVCCFLFDPISNVIGQEIQADYF